MTILANVKKGTRVKLANGLMATVTNVGSSWTGSINRIDIRPDGGTYKTRSYNLDGTNTERISKLYVVEVMTADAKAQLEEAKAKVAELTAILDKQADDGSEEQMMDFGDGNLVKAKRHLNPEGDFGGFVAATATVSPAARISRGSVVYGTAQVLAGAKLKNKSRAFGSARVMSELDGIVTDGRTIRPVDAE
jgi:sRNA-binding protein